ncbi:ROK family transcriptional regulator [Microbacterium sp. Leaf288]|uniref:ROK family transcriptional regulator n=1 Tax=Microbacterium sp. Leaf288 TaxID=1736323 RepID=UPI0012F73275|nr:ROK family transcriptional regulator [Microbacterium sp. Leaf288]
MTTTSRLIAPRPEVLASMTDQHVLAVLSDARAPMSRAEVAEASGLSKPAVAAAVTRLVDRGVLRDVGIREGRRGGVATLFELNPGFGRSLAVVIDNDFITVQAMDLHGTVQSTLEVRAAPHHKLDDVAATTNRLLAESAAAYSVPLLAAAVSIADPVDADTGDPIVLSKSVFPAPNFRPRSELQLHEAERLVIDNDVNWATIGEHRTGALKDCDDFIYVYLGDGLGAGLLFDGRLLRGRRGLSGEIGYLRPDPSEDVDITEKLAGLGLGKAGSHVFDLPTAVALLGRRPLPPAARAIASTLGLAVANMAISLNPSAIAFGGPLSEFPEFTAALAERVAMLTTDPPRFVTSQVTPLAGAALEAHRLALEAAGVPQWIAS